MKLTKVNNDSLRILDLNEFKVAFSYREPVAIMIGKSVFITDESFSQTTAKHKSIIAGIWNVDINESMLDKDTFKCLKNCILSDIGRMVENRKPYIEQLTQI